MGFAIAAEAARRGAEVTLVTGPTSVETPPVREVVRVRSADDMRHAVLDRADDVHVVVMAAAVADYTPVSRADHKVSKDGDTLTVTLRRTTDILAELGQRRIARGGGPVLVGFAAETEQVVARANAKRERKHVDLVVANDVSRHDAGFDVDTNAVTIVGPDGAESLPVQPKTRVAAEILNRVEKLLAPAWTATNSRNT
jgi:phosphopantothenoylcysteine decarboxylase/phosphopantothenate--cysteine ligase